MRKTFVGKAAIGGAAILLLSGCGSAGSTAGKSSSAPTVVSTAAARNPKLGGANVLVDSEGFTLYAFSKDPKNTFLPHCNGSCEATWPPLILSGSAPVAAGEALGTQLGAIKRRDGKLQVDYAGRLLYTYALEKKPGQALGNDVSSFGGTWHALDPPGHGGLAIGGLSSSAYACRRSAGAPGQPYDLPSGGPPLALLGAAACQRDRHREAHSAMQGDLVNLSGDAATSPKRPGRRHC